MQIGAADDNGTGSAVISNRQMQPVGHQGIFLAAKHDAYIGGMLARGIKVRVIANLHRQQHLHIALSGERTRAKLGIVSKCRFIGAEQLREALRHLVPRLATRRHEPIQRRCGKPTAREQSMFLKHVQIEDLISNRNADRCRISARPHENTVRQILNRKMRVRRYVDERF